jgi:hypothetical protein
VTQRLTVYGAVSRGNQDRLIGCGDLGQGVVAADGTKALALLAAGKPIRYEGAIGPIDLDPNPASARRC